MVCEGVRRLYISRVMIFLPCGMVVLSFEEDFGFFTEDNYRMRLHWIQCFVTSVGPPAVESFNGSAWLGGCETINQFAH
jgi:hypothetical protein